MTESKVEIAYGLCLKIAAIAACDDHDEIYLDLSSGDASDVVDDILADDPGAIKLFEDRKEMENCVQEALDSVFSECNLCLIRDEQ